MRVRTTSPSLAQQGAEYTTPIPKPYVGLYNSDVSKADEAFSAGEAPLLLQRHAQGPEVSLELVQGGVSRTFVLVEGKLIGFASSHPEEQEDPKLPSSERALLPVVALARLVPYAGEFHLLREPGSVGGPLDLPVAWVILEALRRTVDPAPVLSFVNCEQPFVRAQKELPPKLALTPLEAFVWDRLQTPQRLESLQRLVPSQSEALKRAFAGLVCADLIVPEKPLEPPPSKPAFPAVKSELRERLSALSKGEQSPSAEAPGVTHAEPTESPLPELSEDDILQAQQDKERAFAWLAGGGNERQAVRLLSRAVEVVPDPHSLVCLAEAELANPMWRGRALAHLKQALEMDATFTPAWLALANYWALRGNVEKQKRCLESVLKYDPKNADVAEALRHLGKE